MVPIPFNEYYMLIALAVRERANCHGRRVGAILVKDNRIIGTGYNGTPEGMLNCEDGGCIRCQKYRNQGEWYDKCICVHAEQNAIVTAARLHCIEGAIAYTTLQPCFSCLKEMLQAKVETVYYFEKLDEKTLKKQKLNKKAAVKDFKNQYEIILNKFSKTPNALTMENLPTAFKDMKDYMQGKS